MSGHVITIEQGGTEWVCTCGYERTGFEDYDRADAAAGEHLNAAGLDVSANAGRSYSLLIDVEKVEAMICHQSPVEHDCHVLACYIDAEEMREYLRDRTPRGSM